MKENKGPYNYYSIHDCTALASAASPTIAPILVPTAYSSIAGGGELDCARTPCAVLHAHVHETRV